MRAVICKTFPGYTFETVDRLPLERVIEIYTSAEWLAEEEKKMIDKAARRSR
ncbi:MAG: hypothetical protein P9X24_06000 [Candidatus Hatepunaea meridiana]|nr:hypothetical protein [Candidatus Hatepunaea meridiana]